MENNSSKLIYLTPQEVANRLKVGVYTVYEWRKLGLLSGCRLGRLLRFREDEVINFVESQRIVGGVAVLANGRRRKNGAY